MSRGNYVAGRTSWKRSAFRGKFPVLRGKPGQNKSYGGPVTFDSSLNTVRFSEMRKSAKTSSQGGFPYGQTVGGTSARPRTRDASRLAASRARRAARGRSSRRRRRAPPAKRVRYTPTFRRTSPAKASRRAGNSASSLAVDFYLICDWSRICRLPRPHWLLHSISSAIGLKRQLIAHTSAVNLYYSP